MKKSTDQRAVSLLLWIFAILAICQLTMQRAATVAIDDLSVRVSGRDSTRVFIAALDQVRGDLLGSSLLSILGLALGLLGLKILSRRLHRRRMSALAASESEHFARSTVDALTSHIAILDQVGVVLAANRAWRAFGERADLPLARLRRSAEGGNYLVDCDLLAGQGHPQATTVGNAIRAVTGGRSEVATVEYSIVPNAANDTGAEALWFLASVTRFPGDGPLRVVVAHEDITARKQAEAALLRAAESAESANRAKSDFLANMSHEIRTPMTAILGYADMLMDPGHSPEDHQKCGQTIRRNGEHLLGIINDILDISKIEANHMTTERVPCDTRQILSDVVALTRPRALQKQLQFEVVLDGRVPARIQTDPLRLKQVLVNLVGNAVKFTRKGQITLRVSCEDALRGGSIHFDVADTGIGMTEEQLARVFQPFTQADGSTSRRFGGTGLGLTISKRLAGLLGGDILVRSRSGEGSTFSVWVDAGLLGDVEMLEDLSDLDAAVPAPTPATEIALAGRILLVEDGVDNQELLSLHLRRAGAQVVIAGNGRLAIEAVTATTAADAFDLILMDMQMPEMDGYEATRELRASGFTRPIVALTAHASAEERPRCLAAGCTDFLGKPITREQLLELAGRHLPHRRIATAPPAAKPSAQSIAPRPAKRNPAPRLRSSHAGNPKMQEILAKFVSRLPDRVNQLQQLLAEEDLDALKLAAHQLKGAAGGYGFTPLTDAAGRVEARIKTHDAFDAISEEVKSLIGLISQVEGYAAVDPHVAKQRVLLLDDDPSIHDLIRVSLAADAVELHSVYEGAAALALAGSIKPDLILLDLELSNTHGFEVCRQLKSDPAIAQVPIIFITSTGGTADKIKGLTLGAVDYITKPFDPGEARARILAALRAKQLQDQLARNANVDVLTGVGNRRYFDQRVATELSRSRRHGQPLSCVMLDLDHFKTINDTHGHPFGDEVLRRLGQLLTETCRTEDVVCRYGGEEFVVLTPGLDRKHASALAERLRKALAAFNLQAGGVPVKITCSFGVSELDPNTHTSTELVRRADKALYKAKRGGRNRVVCLISRPTPANDTSK